MLAGFSFLHDGRTYSCVAADGPGEPKEPWWWFTVTRDANRYAPFRAASKDTRASVEARILAYYKNHLEHRAMPESQHWARRPKPGAPGMAGGNGAGGAAAAANRARVAAEVAARIAAEEKAAKEAAAPKQPVPGVKAARPKRKLFAKRVAAPAAKAGPATKKRPLYAKRVAAPQKPPKRTVLKTASKKVAKRPVAKKAMAAKRMVAKGKKR